MLESAGRFRSLVLPGEPLRSASMKWAAPQPTPSWDLSGLIPDVLLLQLTVARSNSQHPLGSWPWQQHQIPCYQARHRQLLVGLAEYALLPRMPCWTPNSPSFLPLCRLIRNAAVTKRTRVLDVVYNASNMVNCALSAPDLLISLFCDTGACPHQDTGQERHCSGQFRLSS